MSPQEKAAIYTGIFTLLGISLTLLITNAHNIKQLKLQMKHQSKETFISTTYELRMNAHKKLFEQLQKFKNYFSLFVSENIEFTNSLDLGQFAPLEHVNQLKELYEEEALWLTSDSEEAFKALFQIGYEACSVALSIHTTKDVEELDFTSRIEPMCDKVIEETQKVQQIVRESIGISYLEENKANWHSKNHIKEAAANRE
ncbi:hypothetical protein [Priestia megaterium]|uniref:hypothetical protein n=1 Tax=Priestia megaterium TaxID=1404 RepID=UPI001F12A4F3|nr:hypothetical protein [Priestia megaterium]UMZ35530.1 hypothetical protein MGJ28_12925 [Priestia megaterium]